MASKRRNKTDQRKVKAEIRARLSNGMTDAEIMEEVGLTPAVYSTYKQQVLSDGLNEATCSSAGETWARYSLLMMGCVRDLDNIILQGNEAYADRGDTKPMTAVVGAIKAKAQILDGIIDRGQNLGVVHKEPDRSISVAGISVSSADPQRIETLVNERKKLLEDLMGSYGHTDYSGHVLEHEEIYTQAGGDDE